MKRFLILGLFLIILVVSVVAGDVSDLDMDTPWLLERTYPGFVFKRDGENVLIGNFDGDG